MPGAATKTYSSVVSRRAPLSGFTFSLVGPGKVGASLASWAVARGAEAVALGVRRQDDEAARELAGRLDCVTISYERLKSGDQDLLLITVPDPVLEPVARSLARRSQASVVLHTSGSRDASVLRSLTHRGTPRQGSAIGSFHPLKAFPQPLTDPAQAEGLLFGVDGDAEALETCRRLARAWGAETVEIPASGRLIYHFAASLAAGGVVTLMAAAAELLERAGLPRRVLDGYFELSRGALARAEAAPDPSLALTGPVARGDRETVLAELDAVEASAPELVPTVLAVALETLRQGERRAEAGNGSEMDSRRDGRRSLERDLEERSRRLEEALQAVVRSGGPS